MPTTSSSHVAVIGAGAVGVISAIELLRAGHQVSLIEAGLPGGEQAASYGNAGWLSSHSVIPPAVPGIWKKIPGYLRDPLGPLAIRPRYLPKAAPWLISSLASGWTPAKVEATAQALRELLRDTGPLHKALANEAGCGPLIEEKGLMQLYTSRAVYEADGLTWDIRRRLGLEWTEITAEELWQHEPDLDRRYGFATLLEGGARCCNPGRYVEALSQYAQRLGAKIVKARATGFILDWDRLRAVETDQGPVACTIAVIAAGIHAKPLAESLGDFLPLETERGYHVMIEGAEAGPQISCMASDNKMAVNPLETGLRAAGQVEIAGVDAPPDWRRADVLLKNLQLMYPGLPKHIPDHRLKRWFGHRPSMPDGLPCLGHAHASRDVIYAFGHGHVGLAASARTGRLVAQMLGGQSPDIALAPFDPKRFF